MKLKLCGIGILLLSLMGIVTYATGGTTTGTVTVSQICAITVNTPAINFGALSAGASSWTNTLVTITNAGNFDTNALVSGVAWTGQSDGSKTFEVSNTLWSSAAQTSYTGTALTGLGVDTLISLNGNSATQNSIYFGLKIPSFQYPQVYNSVITISSSC